MKEILGHLRRRLSLTAALELLEAAAGKKVSRLGFSENHLPWLDQVVAALGAHWEPAYAPFRHTPDTGKGNWASRSEQATADLPVERSWQVFIADSPERARAARDLEAENDERGFGAALGIPSCCVAFYVQARAQASPAQNDFTMLSASRTGTTTLLPHWTNTLTQYFGETLLSFAPCSYRCTAAIDYARKRHDFATSIDPAIAEALQQRQRCAGLYTDFEGVHLFRVSRRTREHLEIEPGSIASTHSLGSLGSLMGRARKVRFVSGGSEIEDSEGQRHALDGGESVVLDFVQVP